MTIEQVVQQARDADVRLVRFLYCDNGGIIRGKLAHIERLAERMAGGIGLTVAMQAMNMLDQLQPMEELGPVGEIRLVPDPESFKILPYAPHTGAMVTDMMTLDRRPWGVCPRSFLKRMVDQAAEQGIVIQAAFENEYSLLREEGGRYVPIDTALCFSSIGMTAAAAVVDDTVSALEAQGIPAEQYYPELGHGQQELSISHADALRAADNQVFYRETIRNVAHRHGLIASLAPKPLPDQAGNGCHIHWSLWDPAGQQNLGSGSGEAYSLSPAGRHFIAGVLAHLPGLVALTCASYNSYRRLQPRSWSSAYVCWGHDNREAAVRVASGLWGQEAAKSNFELKSSDPSNNPYLALGGLIAAGLDGIARELDPGEPVNVDPATLSETERVARGIDRLPTSLEEALGNLEKDEVLMEALGEPLARAYVTVKRSEYDSFASHDADFEIQHHIHKF